MSEYDWESPRLREDMQMKAVPGGPVNYANRTDKPVEYVTVVDDNNEIQGYLWACDADDAASFQVRPAAGARAYNSGISWTMELRQAKARGVTPSQALAEFASSTSRLPGRIVPGSRAQASSLDELRELAGPEPERPSAPRRGR